MSSGKRFISIIPIFLSLFIFVQFAQAEAPFDITECASITINMVSDIKEFMVFGLEAKGIVFSHHENKAFNNSAFHVVGINKATGGKRVGDNYFKFIDPDGDVIVGEISVVEPEKTMTFLYGTGKWKGIKGGGKGTTTARSRPVASGTAQSCSRYTGTFDLVK
jgi:hypothetical protein